MFHHLGSSAHRRARRFPTLCAIVALVSGATLIGTMASAQAATPVSQARGQFLTGEVGGVSLDNLVVLPGAQANNAGGPTQTEVNPLDVTALQALNVDLGSGINLLGSNHLLGLGAVNQYAQANPDGSSQASSGAVNNDGSVAVGGSPTFPANATLNLQPLIGPALAGALSDADVTVGALSSTASQSVAGAQSGTYQIANLSLNLNSPLISGIVTNLKASLVALQPVVNGLPAQIRALPGVGPLATITNLPNLATVTDSLTSVTSADGSMSANLQTGAVSIDVAKLLATTGLSLNTLPANTELLPYLTAGLTTQLLPALTAALTGLDAQLTSAVNGISVSVLGVPVALAVLAPVLNPVIAQLVAPVNATSSGLGSSVITPLATALTGLIGLRANVKQNANGTFTQRALILSLLPVAASPGQDLAEVDLASSSVGPNAGPVAAPTTTTLTPNTGPVAGGQTVTLAGTGFVPASTTVSIGGITVPAAAVTVNSDTSLTFNTPAHPAGSVDVTVSTPSGTSTPALPYTYVAAPITPTALSLSPTTGPVSGGQAVAINGSGFVPGSTSVSIGGTSIPAAAVTVVDDADLTFVTPAHAAGPVGVSVTTAGGSSSPALQYTYETGPITPEPPVALSLSPNTGPVAGGQTVSIYGNNFVAGSTSVTIGAITVPAAAIDVTSATTLTFTTPAQPAGPVGVSVTTPAGTSTPELDYTYQSGPIPAQPPVALLLAPASGPITGGQTVAVVGQNFVPGATSVTIGGSVVPAAAVSVQSPTALSFSTPAHAAGPVGVTVSTAGGSSSPALQYTYETGPITPTPPVALDLSPDHGPVTGGQAVIVSGSGFVAGATSVTIGGTLAPAAAVTVSSTNSLTFTTPAGAAGAADVTVTTPTGTSSPALQYTYETGPITPDPPVALTISPASGPIVGGQTVSLSGTGFVPGATTVTIGGNDVPAAVISPTGLTFTTPAHPAGIVDVSVTTPNGASSPALQYTYESGPITPEPPVALSLAPKSGPVAGGQSVSISGIGFVPGATTVTIGGTAVPATVSSTSTLTFSTPPHPAGAVDVTVSSPAGTSSPALQYTYESGPSTPEPPVAFQLAPSSGPVAGGQIVTVIGQNFVPSQTNVTVDATPVPATVISPTALSFVTPAHVAGDVDVTVTTPNGASTPALPYSYVNGPVPPATPVALSLSPSAGPTTGGQTVAVLGAGFVAGATTVTIGQIVVPATGVTVTSESTLTFTTPAHPAGPVKVTVTTPGGSSSPALAYTYQSGPVTLGAPIALGLAPAFGPIAGGQTVAVTGAGFVGGATTVTIGGTTVPATVLSATALTFIAPGHGAGPVDVTVTTTNGTSSPALPYTYVAGPVLPVPPVALLLTPSSGPTGGGQTVTVTGLGFEAGTTTVTIGRITVPVAGVSVTSRTSLTFSTPAHPAGPVSVTVSSSAGTSSPPLSYTYLAVVPPPPSALSLTPPAGPAGGGQVVTVTGSGFVAGATSVTIGGVSVPATAVTVTAPTSLHFRTPVHPAGAVSVTVHTAAGTSAPGLAYRYLAGVPVSPPAPVIDTPQEGATVSNPQPVILGTGIAGDTVSVQEGTRPLCRAIVGPDGRWQCTVQTTLADGNHTVTATQTDPAGLYSPESAPRAFTVAASGILGVDAGSGNGDSGGSGAGPGNGTLPDTGAPAIDLVVLAVALLGIGAVLAAAANRRRPHPAAVRGRR